MNARLVPGRLVLGLPVLSLLVAARVATAQPTVVVSAGDMAPTGQPFSTFSDAALDDRGGIAFLGGSTSAFHHDGSSTPHLLAAGDVLPGGGVVAGVGAPVLGADGCTTFRAFLVGGGDGIIQQCGGSPTAIVSRGDAAPGGGSYVSFMPTVAVGGGVVAFGARLDDGTTALFAAHGATVSTVVHTGSPSPNGGTFTTLRLVGVSANGHVGFRGFVANGSDGLFSFDGATLAAVVVLGQSSPAGGSFMSIGNGSINDGGTWSFRAGVSMSPGSGIFRATVGGGVPQISVVAREGDAVPEPLGGKFRPFPTSLAPTINADGAVAFRGTVTGGTSGSGIFVAQPGGAPTLIVSAADEASDLARFRDVAIAADGSLLLAASPIGGSPGLFVVRNGTTTPLVGLEDATDLGTGFRFSAPSVRSTAESGVFLGQREGIFIARSPGVVESIALPGGAAPGGGVYAGFDAPSAGAGGRIAFRADIAHSRRHASEGVFVASEGRVRRVAHVGGHAPGGGDFVGFFGGAVDGVVRADVGAAGVSFEATLERARATTGLFLWNRTLQPLARGRQVAPGGGRYAGFGTPSTGAAGQVAFVANVGGSIGNQGVALRTGARTRFLMRAGDTTDTRAGGRFQSFDACDLGPAGVTFRAVVSSAVRQGIFLARDQQRGALVLAGDAAPGGGSFGTMSSPALAAQSVVFQGQVVDQAVANGLYRISAATVPTARDPPLPVEPLLLPGGTLPSGGIILDVGHPTTTDSGTIAATVQLAAGPSPTAIVTLPPAP